MRQHHRRGASPLNVYRGVSRTGTSRGQADLRNEMMRSAEGVKHMNDVRPHLATLLMASVAIAWVSFSGL